MPTREGRIVYQIAPVSPITVNGNTAWLYAGDLDELAVDILISAPVGGTTPSIQFFVDRQMTDGSNWASLWTGAVNTGGTTASASIGRGAQTNTVLGQWVRLRWVVVSNASWGVTGGLSGKG